MKKILSVVLTLLILLSCLPTAFAVGTSTQATATTGAVSTKDNTVKFSDVDANTLEGQAIYKLANAGIVNGNGDGTFAPNSGLTRAELCKMINLVFGYREADTVQFNDVKPEDWFAPYVLIAKKAGYINGYEEAVEAYEELFWKMWGKAVPDFLMKRGKPSPSSYAERSGEAVVAFAPRWPRENPEIMRQTYSIAIDNAEHLIQIVNPYATLFGEVRAALRRALERGVRVQFMVSTRSDGKAIDDVIGLEMRKLMNRGAEVYYYDGGFHHSKIMMIDGLFCTVGTTNLDARSLRFDYEVNAFIFDHATTRQLQQIFRNDAEKSSTLLTPEVFKERFPLRRRFRSRIFTLAKRFL